MLHVTNTLSGQKEPFVPLEANKVKMYVCGPTVYGLLHIGNGRTFMFWDIARRYLRYRGFDVTYVQNFTDIDDKIIKRAAEEGVTAAEIARKYTDAYFEDMDGLGVRRADIYPRATETLPGMIAHIQGLVEKGFAYESHGDVYFRVQRFEGYGKLSKRKLDDLIPGARVEADVEKKEDPLDFALWKAAKPGEPAWESPWGPGRPGWHIECSAMVRQVLGDTIDIHAGGMDLKFPHHENEIAQSEALTEHPFVRFWLHTGFLNMGDEKMSKSLGNIKTVRDALATYGQQALRVFLLRTHYSTTLAFSDEGVKAAFAGLQSLRKSLARYEGQFGAADAPLVRALVEEARAGFTAAMDDDFNTPQAIAHFDLIANKLRKLAKEQPELTAGFGAVVSELREEADVLGLDLSAPEEEAQGELSDELTAGLLELLIELRRDAKAQKNWALADQIRNRLKDQGVQLVDQKDGSTTWELAPKVLA
ncbi:MAG TPA: cysteine--tRNA ligase [Oscillatoriaceae cyanobacterium]